MKRHKNLGIAVFTVVLFLGPDAISRAQTTQQTGGSGQSPSSTAQDKAAGPSAAKSPENPANASAPPPVSGAPPNKTIVVPKIPPAKTDTRPSTQPAKGSGMVWVNIETGVYHKRGTRWYGKTKHGKYMMEADALKAGYRAAARD
jgi:hypothetical protein